MSKKPKPCKPKPKEDITFVVGKVVGSGEAYPGLTLRFDPPEWEWPLRPNPAQLITPIHIK